MVYTYNKLVRDKIVDIINKEGKQATYRVLNDEEYLNEFNIVGEKSYGKGIAQTEVNLSNGGTIHYTFAKVYDPGGELSIHKEGITPDYKIPLESYEIGNAFSYYTSITNQLEKSIIYAVD